MPDVNDMFWFVEKKIVDLNQRISDLEKQGASEKIVDKRYDELCSLERLRDEYLRSKVTEA